MKVKVLIVDDHGVVQQGLAALMSYEDWIEISGTAASGEAAVVAYAEDRPDVVLMDLQLPDMDGAQATRELLARDPEAKILMLTTYGGDEDIRRAMAAGARGYLVKSCEAEELLRAIRTVVREGAYLTSATKQLLESEPPANLSAREIEVLQLIAAGKSNREIARDLFLAEATARTHVGHIFAKLGVNDRLEAVMAAQRRGILRGS